VTSQPPIKCDPFPNNPPQQIVCLKQSIDKLRTDLGTLQKQVNTDIGNAVKKGEPVNIVHRMLNINTDECLTGGQLGGPGQMTNRCATDQNQTWTIRDSAFK
jgi:hypothetical protein